MGGGLSPARSICQNIKKQTGFVTDLFSLYLIFGLVDYVNSFERWIHAGCVCACDGAAEGGGDEWFTGIPAIMNTSASPRGGAVLII